MIPLDTAKAPEIIHRLGLEAGPGLLALRHALAFRGPGVWGDSLETPRSLILIREGDNQLEAFGAGEPEPAVGWLVEHRRPFTLLAPERWLDAVLARLGAVDEDEVETWSCGVLPVATLGATRLLTLDDRAGFMALAPSWTLRGWRSYPALIEHGAAFGVPDGQGYVALAWVFDQADPYDALGVYTAPRYRRLGLGQAAASALCAHIVEHRGRVPLWSTHPVNNASRALARAGVHPDGHRAALALAASGGFAMNPRYAIELDLRDRTALVVGLGEVGRRKALGLLKAGARVIGVDPVVDPDIEGLDLRAEPYRAEHLSGVSLAFAAGPPELNRQVVADARQAGIWVNSASEPQAGDFAVPAVWRDGGLTLTVSTDGASPALAAALRDRAAAALSPSAAGLAEILAEIRPIVLARLADNPETRRRIMADWADLRWLDLYARSGPDAVREEILRTLDRENPIK